MTDSVQPWSGGIDEEILGVISELVRRITALEGRLEALERARPGGPSPDRSEPAAPTPFRWDELSATELSSTLRELGAWVTWLTARFRLDALPPCWFRHSDLVEELTGLWLAWLGAYEREARADEPVRWLDWLHRARSRFAHYSPRCGVGAHKEFQTPPAHDERDFAAFVELQASGVAAPVGTSGVQSDGRSER